MILSDCAKAPGLYCGAVNFCVLRASKPRGSSDRKRMNINNIDPFAIVEPRELSRSGKRKNSPPRSINRSKTTLYSIYFMIISSIIFLLNPSEAKAATRSIAVQGRPDWIGEKETISRLTLAAANLGWACDIVDYQSMNIDQKEYDFVICYVRDAYKSRHTTYFVLSGGVSEKFFLDDGTLKEEFASYNAYLVIYNFANRTQNLKTTPSASWKFWSPLAPYMENWYPTAQFVAYQEVDPKYLFYPCAVWGNRAKDEKYKKLLSLLDKQPYTKFYGKKDFARTYGSYVSYIPADGVSLIREIQKNGVSLLLHSENHLRDKIPSGRIFEAAAASSVIISDQNAFVIENFGDSVLYINETLDAVEMLNQIDAHMQWILSHKKEALAMAKRAHEIYAKRFLFEDQLLRLEKFHMNIMSDNFN